MQSLQDLYEIFEAAFPDIVSEPPFLIQASEDSKVGQFRGHKNSVGFLAGYSCSWMTKMCYGKCYTERGRSGQDIAYMFRARNTWALFECLLRKDLEGLTDRFSDLIQFSHDQYNRKEKALKKKRTKDSKKILKDMLRAGPMFRWMWSGDLVDAIHAMAVRDSSARHPEVTSWIYTRSFHLLQHLEPVPPNLTVWLSEDQDNMTIAEGYAKAFPWVRRTTLTKLEDVPSTGVTCPENTGALPVERACARCQLCSHARVKEVNFIAADINTYRRDTNPALLQIAA